MPIPILETKLYVAPLRRETVPRPALIARLNAGLERKLTLVSAPAGSGKSTLVSAWLHGSERPSTWLSLDEGDNEPLRFFAHLAAALNKVVGGIEQGVLRLLEASPSPRTEALVETLINDIAGDAEPFVLVLDDYHTIHELAIHDALGFFLDRQPPEIHLVILTRHDPPLPLARLRGRGQMTEIRQEDLRFSHDEAASFLRQAMGLQLSDDEIGALEERTEGWITGLQLAALSMQGRDRESVARFIEGFSGRHHFVLDYLTDEVLRRQPERLQQFLLHTSALERMSGPLCDAILDVADWDAPSRETLQQLDAANLFVVPLDDEREWYRYHQLFAELLRARLQETDAAHLPELHRRAAGWYEAQGWGSEAVHHALATGDHELAADVIQRQIMKLSTWSRLDVSMLLRWLGALPEGVLRSRPWLWLFSFRARYSAGQVVDSVQELDELDQALQANPSLPDAERVLRLVAADRASLAAVRGDVRQAVEFAEKQLKQLSEDDTLGRTRAMAVLGMAHFRGGEMDRAREAFTEAIELAQKAGMAIAAIPFFCNVAEVEIAQGKLRQARRSCEQALQAGTVAGKLMATAGFVGLVLGEILYEQNDLRAAERQLVNGLALLSQGGIGEHFGNMHAVLALVKQAQGDSEAAQAEIEWAAQIVEGGSIPRLSTVLSAYQARIWLAQGKLELAVRWAQDYQQLGETEYLREFEDLTLARVLLADERPDEALALLAGMLASAQAGGRLGRVIEIQALRGLALQEVGKREEALAALQAALAPAKPEGYVRVFVDSGEPMRALLKRAAQRGIEPGYVAYLLASFDAPARAADEEPLVEQPLVEPLSERELEVLELLSEGLSNREIGGRLYISLPTVKSHTRNIYGKLGVHSRREAVARARALGMLPSA